MAQWRGAVLLAEGTSIQPQHVSLGDPAGEGPWNDVPDDAQTLVERKKRLRAESVERVERLFVLKALRDAGWNVSEAARKVGMQRPNLHALMKKYGISAGEPPEGMDEGEDS